MVAPLIFGAQRFGASGGLAVEKSDMQDGVAGGLGWADGELDLTGGGGAAAAARRIRRALRRALQSTAPGDEADGEEGEEDIVEPPADSTAVKLYNQILTVLLATLAVCGLEGAVVWYWRHRANKGYYAYYAQARVRARLELHLKNNGKIVEEEQEDEKPPAFSPFPNFLICKLLPAAPACRGPLPPQGCARLR